MIDEDKKLEWLAAWFKGDKKPPFTIELRPSNNCNLRCLSCQARGKERYVPEEEMDAKTYSRIIKEAADLGTQHIHLSGGGEPLVKFETAKTILYEIKKNGIMGSMVTNGTLFTKELVEQLVTDGWEYISFSLDGPDATTHDKLRGEGAFEKTDQSIRWFVELKEKSGSDRPWLVICPVISSINHDRIIDFIRYANRTGVKEVLYQPITVREGYPFSNDLPLTDNMKEKVSQQLQDAKALALEYGIKTNIDDLDDLIIDKSCEIDEVIKKDAEKEESDAKIDDESLSIPCYYPWFFMGIRANGIVEPCGVSSELDNLPNVKDKSLSDIWYGKYFSSFRKGLMDGNLPIQCERCCGASVLSIRQIRQKIKKSST